MAARAGGDLAHVRTRLLRRQERELASFGARVRERVVQIVMPRRAQQPELLEVTDVGEIPDERRLKRRELLRQLLVRERFEQVLRPPSRAPESGNELRR